MFNDSYNLIFDNDCLARGYSCISKEVPKIEYFQINNGDASTSLRQVTLNTKCRVCPTHYRVLDNNNTWAGWSSYFEYSESFGHMLQAGLTYPMNLSASIIVKNAAGESIRHSDNILYTGDPIIFKSTGYNSNGNENTAFVLDNADISVYPVPATNTVYLTVSKDMPDTYSFVLLDTKGMIIKQNEINSTETEIDISNLSNGVYIIRIIGNDKTFTKKIIKQ